MCVCFSSKWKAGWVIASCCVCNGIQLFLPFILIIQVNLFNWIHNLFRNYPNRQQLAWMNCCMSHCLRKPSESSHQKQGPILYLDAFQQPASSKCRVCTSDRIIVSCINKTVFICLYDAGVGCSRWKVQMGFSCLRFSFIHSPGW